MRDETMINLGVTTLWGKVLSFVIGLAFYFFPTHHCYSTGKSTDEKQCSSHWLITAWCCLSTTPENIRTLLGFDVVRGYR